MKAENLCISCMQEKAHPGDVCPHCGLNPAEYTVQNHHLEPYTILNGRYMLGKVLGEGGFGITYVAMDLAEEKRVAIKELFVAGLLKRERTRTVLVDASKSGQDFYKECKQKFLQEAELLHRLKDKKGVVSIYDLFEENATAYIVMEYLQGDDLLDYVKRRGGRIPFEEAFNLLKPVMKSLIEMHSVGIFHRDISPDNIRYLSDGNMKIMDLGGAKYNYRQFVSTIVLVKKGYAPPEQYVTGYKIGPWMDVYAMAATFYRCITGQVPKESISRSGDDDIQKPTQLGCEIPEETERVLLKGLALQTEDRYTDMYEFYCALKQSIGHQVHPDHRGHLDHQEISVPVEKMDEEYTKLIEKINTDGKEDSKHVSELIFAWIAVIIVVILVAVNWL